MYLGYLCYFRMYQGYSILCFGYLRYCLLYPEYSLVYFGYLRYCLLYPRYSIMFFFVYIRYLLFYPGYYIPYLFKDFCNFIQDTSRLFKMFIFVSNLLISVSGTSKMLLLYLEDSDKLKFVFSSEKFLPRPCSIFW